MISGSARQNFYPLQLLGISGQRAVLFFAVLFLLGGCASKAPLPPTSSLSDLLVQSRTLDDVTVSVSILTNEQAKQQFGVDLAANKLQAVWLNIDNQSDQKFWLLVAALEPRYYSADEAAFMFRNEVDASDMEELRQRFRDLHIRYMFKPGETDEGYLLVPLSEGGRYLNVELAGHERLMRFGFVVTLPDGDFDYEQMYPKQVWAGTEIEELNFDQFREWLRSLPCCAANSSGETGGDPLNLVFVGEPDDVLTSLSRSGWSFTHRITATTVAREVKSALSDTEYLIAPVSSLYAFGRKHDIAFQRARNTIAQRNHMRLWLAPVTIQNKPVWVGQVSRDIGVKFTNKSITLTTHVIDPAVDEAREYVLQSLLTNEAVERFGFVQALEPGTADDPHFNLTDDPYFTDGLRLVVLLSPEPVSPEHARNLHWEEAEGPIAVRQTDEN